MTQKKKSTSIIIQHTEHKVTETPWLIALYMKKCKNSPIKWDPSSSIHLKRNQEIKNYTPNISTTTSANSVNMESIEQMFHKMFQDKIQNKMAEKTINPH